MSCCGNMVVKGVTGMAQAAAVWACKQLGIPIDIAATDGEVKKRRDACRACPESSKGTGKFEGLLTNYSVCHACHCNIKAKTSLVNQECPKGMWGKEIIGEPGGSVSGLPRA